MAEVTFKITEKYTPEVINEILDIERNEGLTVDNFIKRAMNKQNPLHDLFDWDKDRAAMEHWRQRARQIINEVKIIIDNREYYAFENIRVDLGDTAQRVYKPITDIINMEEWRRQMLQKALNQISYWQRQYESFKELKPIFRAIEKTKQRIQKRRIKHEIQHPAR